jgi:hypothetical protein
MTLPTCFDSTARFIAVLPRHRGQHLPKPNVWLVQYRLYYAVNGKLYADAILHQLELADDAIT